MIDIIKKIIAFLEAHPTEVSTVESLLDHALKAKSGPEVLRAAEAAAAQEAIRQ